MAAVIKGAKHAGKRGTYSDVCCLALGPSNSSQASTTSVKLKMFKVVVFGLKERRGGDGRHPPQVHHAVRASAEQQLIMEPVILHGVHPGGGKNSVAWEARHPGGAVKYNGTTMHCGVYIGNVARAG